MAIRERAFGFVSGGTALAGTLSLPRSATPQTGVLLLSGSGPQDRDETIAGAKPFRVLAHALAGAGYAVLRWDDRGVGASAGDYLAASADCLVADVLAARDALVRGAGVSRVVLAGHSQGTLIAARAAVEAPAGTIAGLVLLAGMGVPGRAGLLAQHEAILRDEGWAEVDIAASCEQKAALFDILTAAAQDTRAETRLRDDLAAILTGGAGLDTLDAGTRADIEAALEDLLEWEWRFLLTSDPAADLARVRCPVLALCGDADTQVDGTVNLPAIADAVRRAGQPVETNLLAGHDHLLQAAPDAPPMSEAVRTRIIGWLERRLS